MTDPKRKRDRSGTEEKILQAGIEVFSKYGYDGSTTKRISASAGVNESLIIRYFGTKEGLLLAVLERFIAMGKSERPEYPEQDSLENELLEFVKWRICAHNRSDRRAIFRAILSRAMVDPDVQEAIRKYTPLEGDPFLGQRLKKLKAHGKIPDRASLRQIQDFTGTLLLGTSLISIFIVDQDEASTLERLRMHIRTYVNGL